ncbi:hypothetical protein G7083_07355 [Vibrio sp. HDW18]|uniref:hypothetical protein n=1 Tax=Vibrio sp. HDW18 TaxID=2714948 RepID=UPI00140C146E|nr:hypothetical protein [Vibrio sp. HDW18]QIL85688.1 hypothetical protein G7083_07355 [Vibrio sp. HDW18]
MNVSSSHQTHAINNNLNPKDTFDKFEFAKQIKAVKNIIVTSEQASDCLKIMDQHHDQGNFRLDDGRSYEIKHGQVTRTNRGNLLVRMKEGFVKKSQGLSTSSSDASKFTEALQEDLFTPSQQQLIQQAKEKSIKSLIPRNCKFQYPLYLRDNERFINPAYENLDQELNCPLPVGEHRIFVLTVSMMLNTGMKNHYNKDLINSFSNSQYIDWSERYSHPSIANGEPVYYAGYLHQREEHLEVIRISGHYEQSLNEKQAFLLELYLSLKFSEAYGMQEVKFYEPYDKETNELATDVTIHALEKSPDWESVKNKLICRVFNEDKVKYLNYELNDQQR